MPTENVNVKEAEVYVKMEKAGATVP